MALSDTYKSLLQQQKDEIEKQKQNNITSLDLLHAAQEQKLNEDKKWGESKILINQKIAQGNVNDMYAGMGLSRSGAMDSAQIASNNQVAGSLSRLDRDLTTKANDYRMYIEQEKLKNDNTAASSLLSALSHYEPLIAQAALDEENQRKAEAQAQAQAKAQVEAAAALKAAQTQAARTSPKMSELTKTIMENQKISNTTGKSWDATRSISQMLSSGKINEAEAEYLNNWWNSRYNAEIKNLEEQQILVATGKAAGTTWDVYKSIESMYNSGKINSSVKDSLTSYFKQQENMKNSAISEIEKYRQDYKAKYGAVSKNVIQDYIDDLWAKGKIGNTNNLNEIYKKYITGTTVYGGSSGKA